MCRIHKPTVKRFVPSPYSPSKVYNYQWPPENDARQPTMKTLLERAWQAKRCHQAMNQKNQLAAAAPEEKRPPNLLLRTGKHVELQQAKKKIEPAAAPKERPAAAASDLLVRRGKHALTVKVPHPVEATG